jgi:hypothetical protein
VKEWWEKETTGSNEAAPLAGHLAMGSHDATDLQKVGFVFLGRMMLIELEVVR